LVSNNTRPFLFYPVLLLSFRAIRIVATTNATNFCAVSFCLFLLHAEGRHSSITKKKKENVARRETVLFVLSHLRARAPKLRVVGLFFLFFFVIFSRQSEKEFILFRE
jgi:hypothetical protein